MSDVTQKSLEHPDTLPSYHVILIGINTYKEKPLNGCVRDVRAIQEFLCENVKAPLSVHILIDGELADLIPKEHQRRQSCKPTYTNVISALQKVIEKSKQGDFVYIHFSGHGTMQTPESRFSNTATGDLALILLHEEDDDRTKCLEGPRLAISLKAMADHGLIVTLVLDCCFSASVYRWNNPDIRSLPYAAVTDPAETSYTQRGFATRPLKPNKRDFSMLPNWLINPDNYTILVACGPDEEAREPSFNGKKHGALSYCLIKSLEACSGLKTRHGDILDHLRVTFRRFGIKSQNPALYGNPDLGFFGRAEGNSPGMSLPVIAYKDGGIELQAGRAHGVVNGDVFYLRPYGSSKPESMEQVTTIKIEVTSIGAFTSVGQPTDKNCIRAQTGSITTVHTSSMLRNIFISLDEGLPYDNGNWIEFFRNSSLDLRINHDSEKSDFYITSKHGEYNILDGAKRVIDNLPSLPLESTALTQLCNIMKHLAQYQLVNELANETLSQTFVDSFSVQVINQSGSTLYPNSWFEVKYDEATKLTFTLVNKGRKKLYVYIYNLGPRWEITNICRATYLTVPPRNITNGFTGQMRKTMKLVVPHEVKESGQHHCEDIIKVFVTSEATSFSLFELPKLGGIASARLVSTGVCRGDEDTTEDWATFNFQIRTELN